MRAAWALLAAALLVPGCLGDDPVAPADAGLATVRGLVLDPLLAPLSGARVTLLDDNRTATTGPDGEFAFPGLAGESALVRAEVDGFEGATRRASLLGGDTFLEIVLAPLPVDEPYSVAVEHEGFISCAILVRVGSEASPGTVAGCGDNDPNDTPELEFEFPIEDGVAGVVLELAWEPGNSLASRFSFAATLLANGTARPLGSAEGERYVKLTLPASVARDLLTPGAVLRTRTEPAPSMLDEEAFAGVGAAIAQPFTVVATVFYHAPPPPGYGALAP